MNIKVSKVEFVVVLVDIIENHPSFKAITDANGYLVVPSEKYSDFAHDLGTVLGRLLEKIAKPDAGETF